MNKSEMIIAAVLICYFLIGFSPVRAASDNCLPEFESGIIFDPDNPAKQPTVFTPGESIKVKIDIGRTSGCTGYEYGFKSDNPYIYFDNTEKKYGSIEAIMSIDPNIGMGKNPKITAILSHGIISIENETEIQIVSNTPPKAEATYPDNWPSFTSFTVDCSGSMSGNGFNESDDRVWRCKAVVMDENGEKVISDDEKKAAPGQKMPLLNLKTGAKEVNQIIVEVEDTLGVTSEIDGLIDIDKGDTGRDVPIVRIDDLINCYAGEECFLDASETRNRDENVSKLEFWIMEGNREVKQMGNSGGICAALICKYIFQNSGTFQVKVKAYYFMQKKFGHKIVSVNVINRPATSITSDMPAQPIPAASQAPLEDQSKKKKGEWLPATNRTEFERPQKAPGVNIFAGIAVIMFAYHRSFKNKK